MKNKKAKGFTLVELIVVMAIFSILMVAVMSLVDPVSKVMTKASVREANTSAVDNMKRYLEGNLRYANAIEAHLGKLTDADGLTAFNDDTAANKKVSMEKAVLNFAQQYYINKANSANKPFQGIIRVMEIDNENGGRINEYLFEFESGYVQSVRDNAITDPSDLNYNKFSKKEIIDAKLTNIDGKTGYYTENLDVINPAYYEDYAFYIEPGYNELVRVSHTPKDDKHYCATIQPIAKTKTDGTTYVADTFNPELFSMSIVTYKTGGNYPLKDNPGTPEDESDDPTTPENEGMVFESPVAISNTTMSLLNINSQFAQVNNLRSYYGPVRYKGSALYKGTVTNFDPLVDKVDTNDDNEWDYDMSSQLLNGTTFAQDHTLWYIYDANKNMSDNMYFIYTLPDAQ